MSLPLSTQMWCLTPGCSRAAHISAARIVSKPSGRGAVSPSSWMRNRADTAQPICPGCSSRPQGSPSRRRWAATLLHPSRPDDDRCRTWPAPELLDLRSPVVCVVPRRRSRPPRTGPVPFLPKNCSWSAPRRGIENGPRTALAFVSPCRRDEPHHVAELIRRPRGLGARLASNGS